MADKRAKIGKPKTVFRGEIYTVQQARAVYPSGTVKIFESILRAPTVSVLAFDSNNKLLLTREYREREREIQWRVPAGRVSKGESPRYTAQRELREEAGYRARKLNQFMTSTWNLTNQFMRYIYLASDLVESPLPQDEGEEIKVVPTSLSGAYKMALDGDLADDLISLAIIRLHNKVQRIGLRKMFE